MTQKTTSEKSLLNQHNYFVCWDVQNGQIANFFGHLLMIGFTLMLYPLHKQDPFLTKIFHPQTPHERTEGFVVLSEILMLYLLWFYIGFVVSAQCRKNNKLIREHMTRKYLREIKKEYPELKKFDKVLSNQKAMEDIAAVVCNGLDNETFHSINYIIRDEIWGSGNSANRDVVKKQSFEKVLKLIKNYAAEHPEFVMDVKTVMSQANTTYVLQFNQNTR